MNRYCNLNVWKSPGSQCEPLIKGRRELMDAFPLFFPPLGPRGCPDMVWMEFPRVSSQALAHIPFQRNLLIQFIHLFFMLTSGGLREAIGVSQC